VKDWGVRSVLIFRSVLLGILAFQSFVYSKDFHQMFIADEGDLRESLLLNNNEVGYRRSRNGSNASIRQDKVKIIVDDEIIYKSDEIGIMRHYFVIKVINSLKKEIAKEEKTYHDFKAFAASLEYTLRERGIRAPRLDS